MKLELLLGLGPGSVVGGVARVVTVSRGENGARVTTRGKVRARGMVTKRSEGCDVLFSC